MRRYPLAILGIALTLFGFGVHSATALNPPKIIGAVARESARSGWPHSVTASEGNAIALTVLKSVTRKGTGGDVRCAFPNGTPSRVVCRGRVTIAARQPALSDLTLFKFREDLKIWEDGSWRITYFKVVK